MRHLTSRGSLTRRASPSHIITIVLRFVSDFFGDALLISSDVDSITTQCRQEKGSCQLLRQLVEAEELELELEEVEDQELEEVD